METISLVGNLLEEYWEGEEHHRGIYFDETHAYVINKAFAVAVEHSDNVLPLYYDSTAEDFYEKIIRFYPYENMKKKLRGRYMLFEDEILKKEDLLEIFKSEEKGIEIPKEVIDEQLKEIKKEVSVKRQRQRSIANISVDNSKFLVKVTRSEKKATLIIYEKMSKVSNASKNKNFSLNLNAFHYMLELMLELEENKMSIVDDKKIVVEGVYKYEERKSTVKIAIGLSKGRG